MEHEESAHLVINGNQGVMRRKCSSGTFPMNQQTSLLSCNYLLLVKGLKNITNIKNNSNSN